MQQLLGVFLRTPAGREAPSPAFPPHCHPERDPLAILTACIVQSCSCLEQREIANCSSPHGQLPKPTRVDAPLHAGSQKAKGRDANLNRHRRGVAGQGRWTGTILQLCHSLPARFGASLGVWASVSLGVQAGHQLCPALQRAAAGYKEVTPRAGSVLAAQTLLACKALQGHIYATPATQLKAPRAEQGTPSSGKPPGHA